MKEKFLEILTGVLATDLWKLETGIESGNIKKDLLENFVNKTSNEEIRNLMEGAGKFWLLKKNETIEWLKKNKDELITDPRTDSPTFSFKEKLKVLPGWNSLTPKEKDVLFLSLEYEKKSYEEIKKEVEEIINNKKGDSEDSDSSEKSSKKPKKNEKDFEGDSIGEFVGTPLAGISYQSLLSCYKKDSENRPTRKEFEKIASYPFYLFLLTEDVNKKDQVLERYRTQIGGLNYKELIGTWTKKLFVGLCSNGSEKHEQEVTLNEKIEVLHNELSAEVNTKLLEKAGREEKKINRMLFKALQTIDQQKLTMLLEIKLFFKDVVKKYAKLRKEDYESEEFDNKKWGQRTEEEKLFFYFRNSHWEQMAKKENLELLQKILNKESSSSPKMAPLWLIYIFLVLVAITVPNLKKGALKRYPLFAVKSSERR